MPSPTRCTKHPLLLPHWGVLLQGKYCALNKQPDTNSGPLQLPKSSGDPAETLACILKMLSTDHPGNTPPDEKVNESCSLVPTPALQLGHSKEGTRLPYGDGRTDRNSSTVLLAALFQCFIVPHLLNKTCPHQSFLLANQQAGCGNCLLCHHSQLPKTTWGDRSLRDYRANLEELVKLFLSSFTELWDWNCVMILSIWH